MSDYSIGSRDSSGKTPCKVEDVRAQNSEQALALAQANCPTCEVRDLTGKQVAAGAPVECHDADVFGLLPDGPAYQPGKSVMWYKLKFKSLVKTGLFLFPYFV